ncbi:EthD family reductase [Mangrovimicrobium sediminis]|uniref:EthD family reductase n=1 Tax=Mangrovimicrobium sediminis TaxID=2562682 RepID=A0A4Z0LTN9_9GAMM|nr:EthD domain-containing protein [Haliea sp. SAOS-164]TGD70614.1 EthD family reductase [Haliea sp. SAOS-164]
MIKTTICIKRKVGITRKEFFEYWYNEHANLIKELKDDLKIARYVQSHSIDNEVSESLRASRGGPEMFDGIGEAWFESMEVLSSLGQDEAALKALVTLIEDEKQFIDLENSPFWVAEEKEIF